VRGPSAAAELITALRRLDADQAVEVIVTARGGGSPEDLLPSSDEGLGRAVSQCRTPVVSYEAGAEAYDVPEQEA
jgi:exodeoxyribonuclease VII large subunit